MAIFVYYGGDVRMKNIAKIYLKDTIYRFCYIFFATIACGFVFFAPINAAEDKLKVVTTFTIIADMASRVAGEHVEVVSITAPGVEIHNYAATPRDILKAQDADLILWNGLGLERWFKRFFKSLRNVPETVVSTGVTPLLIGEGPYQGRPNPHAWMSLDGAMIYVDNIAAALAEHDFKNAEIYYKNAEIYKMEIRARIVPIIDKIQMIPEKQRWLVTSEGAFSYLAQDFGLKELFIWPINADQLGTPRQLLNVIETVRTYDIPVVFSESTIPPDLALQVVRETNARYGGVLYVDSLSTKDGPVSTYIDLLGVTSEIILQGLSE